MFGHSTAENQRPELVNHLILPTRIVIREVCFQFPEKLSLAAFLPFEAQAHEGSDRLNSCSCRRLWRTGQRCRQQPGLTPQYIETADGPGARAPTSGGRVAKAYQWSEPYVIIMPHDASYSKTCG